MSEIKNVEFAKNPEPRCPCILLLDTSLSMDGQPINELNLGLKAFQAGIVDDKLAMQRVEIAIVTFGPVVIKQDFISASEFNAPQLSVADETPMGEAIIRALNLLSQRKKEYKKNGIQHFRPWIFLITDGAPTDGNDNWEKAKAALREAEDKKKIAFFAVGVENADMNKLAELSIRQPLQLKGLDFKNMFVWLSASLSSVSHSNPGDDVTLQTPMGWGTV